MLSKAFNIDISLYNYIIFFLENDICFEVLKNLTSKDLEELIPKSFGMRKLISLKIKELRKEVKYFHCCCS